MHGVRDLGPLLTLAAQGLGTVNGANMSNTDGWGVTVVVDITAISGTTPTLTVVIEGLDEASGKWYTLLSSAALNAVATTVLRVFPAGTAAANSIANLPLPMQWRVHATVAGTTPAVTATVGATVHV
jgi:hypothetical protein